MTFWDAVNSLEEQQGEEVDCTQAERISYRVGEQAEAFLAERRQEAVGKLTTEGRHEGVTQLQLAADGGAIPVGELKHPAEADCTATTRRTEVRQLPTAQRNPGRFRDEKARLISVREPDR